MIPALVILSFVIALLLGLVVLTQSGKGGMGAQFGSSGAQQIIGVKKSSDLLERLTWIFAVSLMVLAVGINLLMADQIAQPEQETSPNTEQLDGAAPAPEYFDDEQ